jgi:hypothetical protein
MIKVLRNDELTPEFTNVNGFKLDDDSLIFTGDFVGFANGNNLTQLTLKSTSEKYILSSITYDGETSYLDVIYRAERGTLANVKQ